MGEKSRILLTSMHPTTLMSKAFYGQKKLMSSPWIVGGFLQTTITWWN